MIESAATNPQPEAPSLGLEALARHLHEHPDSLHLAPSEIAARFGVPEAFVRDLIAQIQGPEEPVAIRVDLWKTVLVATMKTGRSLRDAFVRVTNHPYPFVAGTMIAAVALAFLVVGLGSRLGFGPSATPIAASVVAGTVGLHLLVYARHGMARYPLFGGLMCFLLVSPVLITTIGEQPTDNPFGPGFFYGLLGFAGFMLGGVYAVLGVMASLVGGFWKVHRQERVEQNLTRQELLARLFQLQEKLRRISRNPRFMRRRLAFHPLRSAPSFPLAAFVIGIALGLLEVLLLGTTRAALSIPENSTSAVNVVLTLLVTVVSLAVFLAVGYFSGGVRRALVSTFFCFGGTLLAQFIPLGGYGPEHVIENTTKSDILLQLGVFAGLGLVTGVAARIEERSARQKLLNLDDPVSLVAEIVTLQRRLAPKSHSASVMVVDVAQSTRMKANADPLVVEWSFREYQKMVQRVVQRHGGDVLSTAGDGVIAAFQTVPDALEAAKDVQSQISAFNARVNRLETPFRVRIGLHAGEVAAQLSEVQFNELIDIAAHVESAAPVGGIAVTEPVIKELPEERVAAMANRVDNQPIYFVLNPTLSA